VILVLNLLNNVNELRHFLRIVQYYWDMWAKRSEMLAPLADPVWESVAKQRPPMKNKTKKKPSWWDPINQQVFDNI
jgi:hypothetical protein